MEFAQLLLVSVVSILTLLLLFVGFQAFLILRDFRKSIRKLNNILEDAHNVSSSIAKPISTSGNVFESLRQMKTMVDYVAKRPEQKTQKKKDQKDKSQEILQVIKTEETKVSQHQTFIAAKPSSSPRVFKRNGRPLIS